MKGAPKKLPFTVLWMRISLTLNLGTALLLCGWPRQSQGQLPQTREFEAGPTNAVGWLNQGNLFLSSNRYELATQSYSRALELKPDFAAALLNRAISQLRDDQLDRAKNDYENFLRRFSSTNYQAYYGLGEIAYRQKEWRVAEENYEQYLRYAPSNSLEADFIRSRVKEVSARKP